MQLAYTILYVENVPETLAFYQQAFGLQKKFLHESNDYGELDTGTTTLSFSARELMQELGKHPGKADGAAPTFEIAFTTDNVTAAVDKAVAAGAKLVQAAELMSWGQTIAYVRDLNDFLVEICTPIVA